MYQNLRNPLDVFSKIQSIDIVGLCPIILVFRGGKSPKRSGTFTLLHEDLLTILWDNGRDILIQLQRLHDGVDIILPKKETCKNRKMRIVSKFWQDLTFTDLNVSISISISTSISISISICIYLYIYIYIYLIYVTALGGNPPQVVVMILVVLVLRSSNNGSSTRSSTSSSTSSTYFTTRGPYHGGQLTRNTGTADKPQLELAVPDVALPRPQEVVTLTGDPSSWS